MSTETYAVCVTCDAELPTAEAVNEHHASTMAPVHDEPGAISRGHTTRVINPTDEERAEWAARSIVGGAVSSAMDRAFEEIDRAIERGRITEQAATDALSWYPDFEDAWDEWRAEADR